MTLVEVRVEVRPTEDLGKVEKAVLNIFQPEELKVVESGGYKMIVARANSLKSLTKLHELLRRERILDSARKMLSRNADKNTLSFMLNKQAAFNGRVSFVTSESESPLGPIYVYVEHSNIREVIDWLAPKTEKGRPLWEKPMPGD